MDTKKCPYCSSEIAAAAQKCRYCGKWLNEELGREREQTVAINQPVSGTVNKIVNVTLWGGIIGLLASSPQSRLNQVIRAENHAGWRVVQIIPSDSGNLLLFIFRFVLLLITLLMFTQVNGYYVVMEKKANL